MSQEIDKRTVTPQMQRGLAPSPSQITVRPDSGSMCALSVVFVIVGIASIILGLVCATNFTKVYHHYYSETNTALVVLYIAGGVLTGLFNFALAVIVDACQKYRNKKD